jgi:hypothetical protein
MGGRGGGGAITRTPGIRYEHRPSRGSSTLAAVDKATGKDIGYIEWGRNSDIWGVEVDKTRQHRGIATQLYRRASKINGGRLLHSANRTAAGDAFARKVGGHLPPRSDMVH